MRPCSQPIPDLTQARLRRTGYRTYPIDISHKLHPEPLVDLAMFGIEGINHFTRIDNPPYHQRFPGAIDRLFVRRSVAERLVQVNEDLNGDGLKLFVHDAWRPTAVQAYAHDVMMPAMLQETNPELEGEALVRAVEQYWAAPTIDPASPAPHLTGAAVDLSLASIYSGQCLFMGSIFDEVSELGHTDWFETHPAITYSDREAQNNRRVLYHAMTEAGFSNQPYEWWHYSWGDQMWAKLTGQPAAHYGPADLPDQGSAQD